MCEIQGGSIAGTDRKSQKCREKAVFVHFRTHKNPSRVAKNQQEKQPKLPETGLTHSWGDLTFCCPTRNRVRRQSTNRSDFQLLQKGSPMSHMITSVKRFLASEDGPTAVEYAVMLALIVVVCLTAIQAIGTNANTTFNKVAGQI
jgi:pilus assembly protein Flp/PilA